MLREGLARLNATHAATATSGNSLGEDGESDLVGCRNEFVKILGGLARLQDGHTGLAGGFQCCDLVAGQFQDLGGRAHEGDARSFGRSREIRVLRKEAIAGVDGVCPGFLGDADNLLDVQVGADGVTHLADQVSFVGFLTVDRVTVLVRKDGYGLGAQFITSAKRPDRDFAAIGHQNFRKHTSPASLRVDRSVVTVCSAASIKHKSLWQPSQRNRHVRCICVRAIQRHAIANCDLPWPGA